MSRYKQLLILGLGIGLGGCSGGGGSSSTSGSSDNTTTAANAITIDNAGVVPVLSNSVTNTVVYIRNHSNTNISGITYSTQTNTTQPQNASSTIFASLMNSLNGLTNNSANSASTTSNYCSSIPANGSCAYPVITPLLNSSSSQGSILITAHYIANNQPVEFSNIVSFARIYNNQTNGAIINSSVTLSSFGHSNAYATTYVYGSGSGQIYNVSSIGTDKPAVTISNGNISNTQIQSNFVQAVEITSPATNNGITATLTANSNANGQSYTSSVALGVAPVTAGAILTTGQVPLINSSGNNPGGTLFVTNSGNESANITGTSADSGITIGSNSCSANLNPGGSCSVAFTVTQAGGSGNITLTYGNGNGETLTAAQNVTWYNGTSTALAQMSASPNPLVFNATSNANTTVTITNIGGYTLTNLSIPTPIVATGSASAAMIFGEDFCTGQSLAIGNSCTYGVSLSGNSASSGDVILGVSGNYTNATGATTYTREMVLNYTINTFEAVLALTPNPANQMTITGDNNSSTQQTLTLSNNGAAEAINIILTGFSGTAPSYLTESTSTCVTAAKGGATLNSGESCSIVLNLGPTASDQYESGTATYTVTYSGAGSTLPNSKATDTIPWVVQSDAQAIAIVNVQTTGQSGVFGDGESSGSPYIFYGYNAPNGLSLILYVANVGTNPVILTGIQDSNSIYAWQLESDPSTSTCYGATLAPNGTCQLVYGNVLAQNAYGINSGIGASYIENITVPLITFQDSAASDILFQLQPSLPSNYTNPSLVYVTGQQATLSNSVTVAETTIINPNNTQTTTSTATVTSNLANASNYSEITATTAMEDYFTGSGITPSTSSGCNTSTESGIMTQTCALSPSRNGTSVKTVIYTTDPTLYSVESTNLILNTAFSINANGQTVSMSPLAISTSLYVGAN